jgi:hypothetical protein
MPSLRRALSTPSVRVSPYLVLPSSRSHRPHPHGHRRSSGSDVSDRKVLADIDWWRVADGQRERGSEEERDVGEDPHHLPAHSADSEVPPVAILELPTVDHSESAGIEPERPSTPVMSESPPVGQISGYSSQVIFINNGLLISFSTSTLLTCPFLYPFFFFSNSFTFPGSWVFSRRYHALPPGVPRQSRPCPPSTLHPRYYAHPLNDFPLRTWDSRIQD